MNGWKKKVVLATLVAGAWSAAPAFAQFIAPPQQPWYLDLGAGQGKASGDVVDSRKTVWAARLGMRFSPNFAADIDYHDLGKYDLVPNGTASAKAWGASFVAIAPIQAFDIYGRVGYAHTTVDASVNIEGDTFTGKDHQNEAFYGVGARYNLPSSFGVFVEWNKHDKSDIDFWLAGVQFRF